jgi:Tfp pilus assembly protein PilV
MKKRTRYTRIKKNQAGMASIMVTMIIMLIVSLIVLAAARLARREQRQTLDRQLSTQAFYAAESGVNDAVKAIETDLVAGGALLDLDSYTSECSGAGSFINTFGLNQDLNAAAGVKYTCLLVDPTPYTWEGNVGESARAFPIESETAGELISKIEIAWQDKDGGENFACPTDLPASNNWVCDTPLLRFDLVPTPTGSVGRANMNNAVMTQFLRPNPGGPIPTQVTYAPSNGVVPAAKIPVNCNLSNDIKFCKAEITGLASSTSFYLRLKSLYGTSSVTVAAYKSTNDKIELKGAQVVVDSTGIASDILRRIQVRVPIAGAADVPEFAVQSGDHICKLLLVGATVTSNDVGVCPID